MMALSRVEMFDNVFSCFGTVRKCVTERQTDKQTIATGQIKVRKDLACNECRAEKLSVDVS